jgi:hypothetical protein
MKIKQYAVPFDSPNFGYRPGYCLIPETKKETEILKLMERDCSGTNRLGYEGTMKQKDGAVGLLLKLYTEADDEDHTISLRGQGRERSGGDISFRLF